MKQICAILIFCAAFCLPGFVDAQSAESFRQEGIASWYGPEFDGRPTASGEIFNSSLLTAAHPTLPFGTMLLVTNRHNNRQVTVKVNDRGPFVAARIVDVSRAAAEQLDMIVTGTAPVLIEGRVARSVSQAVPPPPAASSTYPQTNPAPVYTPPASMIPIDPPVNPAPVYTPPASMIPIDPPVNSAPVYTPPVSMIPLSPPANSAPVYTPSAALSPVSPQPATAAAPVAAAPTAAPATMPPALLPVVPPIENAQAPGRIKLSPEISPAAGKRYRLQVGSFEVARNAVDAYEKLKIAGLNPAYERNGKFFRVVLAGIQGNEVQSITEKLALAGFKEALIREEH